VNTLGGLQPDTVAANISGSLKARASCVASFSSPFLSPPDLIPMARCPCLELRTCTFLPTLQDFWGVLDDTGHVHNWDGSVSPVVHQLDHFLGEVRVCVVLFCSVLSAAHARTDQLFPL